MALWAAVWLGLTACGSKDPPVDSADSDPAPPATDRDSDFEPEPDTDSDPDTDSPIDTVVGHTGHTGRTGHTGDTAFDPLCTPFIGVSYLSVPTFDCRGFGGGGTGATGDTAGYFTFDCHHCLRFEVDTYYIFTYDFGGEYPYTCDDGVLQDTRYPDTGGYGNGHYDPASEHIFWNGVEYAPGYDLRCAYYNY